MEYLEIRGAVKLMADADRSLLFYVLQQLLKTEFTDGGYIAMHLDNRILSISGEGTISDRYGIEALLDELRSQLIEQSIICITTVRWEVYVDLKYEEPATLNRLDRLPATVQ